jgi:hypothetical protein
MISAETACWENSQIFNEDFYLPLYLPLWDGLTRMSINEYGLTKMSIIGNDTLTGMSVNGKDITGMRINEGGLAKMSINRDSLKE